MNVQTCRATLDFFRGRAREIGFREHGYLCLYADRELWARALDKVGLQNAHGLAVEVLVPADVWARFPLLDRARRDRGGDVLAARRAR